MPSASAEEWWLKHLVSRSYHVSVKGCIVQARYLGRFIKAHFVALDTVHNNM
jgi:hypothetical protein